MKDSMDNSRWYALFVATGQEDQVKERLIYRLKDTCLKVVVPKRLLRERKKGIWANRVRTLFPGYILINGLMGVDEYYLLKRVPGLMTILKNGLDLLEIAPEEIDVIARLTHGSELIGNSSLFMEGDIIEVTEGPLAGLEGLIEKVEKRKGRAKVRLNFIGEPRLVDLSISLLSRAQ